MKLCEIFVSTFQQQKYWSVIKEYMLICLHLDPDVALQKLFMRPHIATFYKIFPLPLKHSPTFPLAEAFSHTFCLHLQFPKFNYPRTIQSSTTIYKSMEFFPPINLFIETLPSLECPGKDSIIRGEMSCRNSKRTEQPRQEITKPGDEGSLN